jgi:protease YdgD
MIGMKARIAAILGLLALTLLAGCGTAAVQGPQIQPRSSLTWQAAVGQLATNAADVHCSAVLVAPDVIVSASHCLFLKTAKRPASPNELIFRPNMGGLQVLPPSRGVAFLGQGAVLRGGRLSNADVSKDWVVVQISPPVTAVQPITVARLTIDGMLHMINSGNRLVTAGYGNGPYDELKVHEKCRLLSQQELGIFPDDSWLQLDCVFRVGDSGGAIVLLDGANQPALVGIIAGFGHMPGDKTAPLGLGVNASNFLPYLRQPISEARPTPADPVLAELPPN